MEHNNKVVRKFIVLAIASITIVSLILKQHSEKKVFNCPGDRIDLNQMLKYGEAINCARITDKYGMLLDMANFSNEPLLVLLVKDYRNNLKAYNDSLHKYLKDYLIKKLHVIYICSECNENPKNKLKFSNTIYCDNDRNSMFTTFKTFGHTSSIIISKDHKVVLSTVSIMAPNDLAKILKYKESQIF